MTNTLRMHEVARSGERRLSLRLRPAKDGFVAQRVLGGIFAACTRTRSALPIVCSK